jgi:hypothetical protein
MTIQLNCGCGRRYQIGDEHAGKKTKCKACGAVHVIPNPEPEEVGVGDDTEVVDAIELDDDQTEVMTALEDDRGGGKKRKGRPAGDESGPVSRQYTAEAREKPRRDELRATAGRRGDGARLSAGVIAGATLLILGLLAIVLIAIFK